MVIRIISQRKKELFFFTAGSLAAVLNYFIYPVISRLLTTSQLNLSIIFLNVSSQIGGVFAVSTVISIYFTTKSNKEVSRIQSDSSFKVLKILYILTLLIIIIYAALVSSLNFNDYLVPTFAIGAASYLGVIGATLIGVYNAKGKFYSSGTFVVMSSLLQLIFCYFTLKFVSATISGLLLAFVIGYTIPLIVFVVRKPRTEKPKKSEYNEVQTSLLKKSATKFVVFAFLAFALLWLSQSFDLYLVNNVGNQELRNVLLISSIYPKAIFFLGYIYIWTVLPKHANNLNFQRKDIIRSLLHLNIFLLIGTVITVMFKPLLDIVLVGYSINGVTATLLLMIAFKIAFVSLCLVVTVSLVRGLAVPTFYYLALMSFLFLVIFVIKGDGVDLALVSSIVLTVIFSYKITYNLVRSN